MRRTSIYSYSNYLVVAYSKSGAIKMFREQFGRVVHSEVKLVEWDVVVTECDEPVRTVNGADCSSVWPTPMLLGEE